MPRWLLRLVFAVALFGAGFGFGHWSGDHDARFDVAQATEAGVDEATAELFRQTDLDQVDKSLVRRIVSEPFQRRGLMKGAVQ